ncbi:MAG: flavodoxin family protein [Desulfohalobiaceae bacterium]
MQEIKLLGISGSPRKSATYRAVEWALEYAREKHHLQTTFFPLRAKKINFCIHCDYCLRKKKGCLHQDDMQQLYEEMQSSDLWLLGSPCYHGHISAQLKAVLDRTRALLALDKDMFAGKIGAGLAVGGDRHGGQEKVLGCLHDFYLINKMLPVSGGAFGANLGGTLWSRDKGAQGIEEDQTGLRSLAKTIDRMLKLMARDA